MPTIQVDPPAVIVPAPPDLRAQRFFADLHAASRAPHYDGRTRDWVEGLLKRAQEAGLYAPGET